jgi:hypothetical protein
LPATDRESDVSKGKRVAAAAAGLVALASGTLVSGGWVSAGRASGAQVSGAVSVRDCPGDHFSVRPGTFVLACADGNAYVDKITWTGWGDAKTTGKGDFVENSCTPSCVAGKFWSEPATITLSKVATRLGHRDYGYVVVTPTPPNKYKLSPWRDSLYYGAS